MISSVRKPINRWLSPSDRRDLLLIRRLEQLNCYETIVRKLAAGETAVSVAKWALNLRVEDCTFAKWSFFTWRTAITALAKQVKRARFEVVGDPGKEPAVEAVAQRYEELKSVMENEDADPIPQAARKVWELVKQNVKSLNAEVAIKYAFVVQQARVEKIVAQENKLGLLMPDAGTRAIVALKDIISEMRKYEIGERYLSGKGGEMPYGGPVQGGVVPHEPSLLAVGMSKFGEVDQNLMTQIGVKFIEMIQEEASGRFKAGRLESDAGANDAAGKDSY